MALLWLEVWIYGLALWLGLYLVSRDPGKPRLLFTGLGLVAYGLSLATDLLAAYAPSQGVAVALVRLHWPLLYLPALAWFGAMVYLLPEEIFLRPLRVERWGCGLLAVTGLFYLVSAGTNLVFDFTTFPPRPGPAYLLFAGLVLLPMLLAVLLTGRLWWTGRPRRFLGLLLAASLFFALGAGLLLFPLDWLPRTWLLLAIGLDIGVLGLVIALLDALEEGEALLPDFFRSFDYALAAALLFGGLVGLTMALATGVTFAMLVLLLATLTAAIASQTFSQAIQAAVDGLALAAFPHLQQARASLRAAADALPRLDESSRPEELSDDQFVHLTRRALSHMGNLPRLAASPLTRLVLIDRRLARRGARDDTLERAAELKALLAESVLRLKPRAQGDFGTSEAWRYYNALYFPYVAGLKPYSRRTELDGLDPAAAEALAWFRTNVPERTLYNWQAAAARLVAQDLRERNDIPATGSNWQ